MHSSLSQIESCHLIDPYGGKLVNLEFSPLDARLARERSRYLRSIQLSERSRPDLELLANGSFPPLDRFIIDQREPLRSS